MAREVGQIWGGSGSRFEFQNQAFDSVSENQCNEAANDRIKKTSKGNNQELLKLRPFGLKLNLTPSLLETMDKNLYNAPKSSSPPSPSPSNEKLKASNFPASLLRIGPWEIRSRNEGELVAKCYYAKKKLVWEILDMGLKYKIEIQWNDILAINAHIKENEPGILHLELSQPPSFHQETDPQPRKHTIWKMTSDFTKGPALRFRCHYLVFPPGVLDKHYDKLLQCDTRLKAASCKPFPSMESPYFDLSQLSYTNYGFNYNRERLFSFSGVPPPLMAVRYGQQYQPTLPALSFKETQSPDSVMEFSHSDERTSTNAYEMAMLAAQGTMNNNNIIFDSSTATLPFNRQNQSNVLAYNHNFNNNPSVLDPEEASNQLVDHMLLRNLADDLLSDTQIAEANFDENYRMARVASLNQLINLSEEVGGGGRDVQGTMVMTGAGEQYYGQQPFSGLPLQGFPENGVMHIGQEGWNNNMSYGSVMADPGIEEFGRVNSMNQLNYWNL
ncbi:uncharacterized protein LOC126674681 [Mercurialis annua]|uniref:uncharacterized protein LOC126674681 n=1 Tax=Mercurialis annua TaxID=3986 RepID=UPI00215F9332|nr:uncharacterized protein LOC126674681 [Mercurialis annua]